MSMAYACFESWHIEQQASLQTKFIVVSCAGVNVENSLKLVPSSSWDLVQIEEIYLRLGTQKIEQNLSDRLYLWQLKNCTL